MAHFANADRAEIDCQNVKRSIGGTLHQTRKATDKRIGRPRNEKKLTRIRALQQQGLGVAVIAGQLKCSKQNIYKALAKTAGQ